MEDSPLEYVNEIDELLMLHEFMQDEDFSEALNLAVQCLVKPGFTKAASLVVKFQAYATMFKMKASNYTYLESGKAGTENNKKKNIYFAMADQCEKLSAAFKYIVRD